MTKKLFLLFSLLILIPIFGCNKECKHEFLEATCVNKEKCIKCGLEQGFPLGHDFLEATTDKPMTCKRCGITSGEPIKKHEHVFLEPTCILPKRCECGYEEGEALGHIEKTIFPDDAECLIPVMAMIKCERCQMVLEEKEIEKPHNMYEETIEPTCTEHGKIYTKCDDCGYYKQKVLLALGHKYEYVIDKEASKSSYGVRHKECMNCHKSENKVAYVLNGFSSHGKLSVKGADLVDKNGEKFQLVGLSTHGLQWFGKYVNYETFESLRNGFGINVIRLSLYTSEDGYCVVSKARKEELFELVCRGIDFATSLDMYVVVDWHMLGAEDPNDRNPLYYMQEALEFFRRITSKYSQNENILFDIMNEPSGPVSWDDCKKYAENVITEIRKNSDGIVVVGNPKWSADLESVMASPLEGFNNIMYSYHFYAGDKTNASSIIKAYEKGFPVFVSEHGGMENTGDGMIYYDYINKWYEDLNKLNISYIAWNISSSKGSASIFKYNSNDYISVDDDNLKEWGIFYRDYVRMLFNLPSYGVLL